MNTTTPQLTDDDWAGLEEAVRGRPSAASPKPAQPSVPPPPRVITADEIVAHEVARAATLNSTPTEATSSVPTNTPARHGVVFADHVPTASPTSAGDSPEVVELRAIRDELRSLCALVATAINKMPGRR